MSTTATITKEPLLKNLEADYDSHPAELVRGGVRCLHLKPKFSY